MLSSKTAQELSWLLDDYGIKHGPVVDSTRALYEKKLREAMAKERKAKRSSYQTINRDREAEEEVTYTRHHRPVRPLKHISFGNRINPVWRSEYEELDTVNEPTVYSTPAFYRNSSLNTATKYETHCELTPQPKPEPFVPLWLQILLFLILVGIVVFVFINMESASMSPFKRLT